MPLKRSRWYEPSRSNRRTCRPYTPRARTTTSLPEDAPTVAVPPAIRNISAPVPGRLRTSRVSMTGAPLENRDITQDLRWSATLLKSCLRDRRSHCMPPTAAEGGAARLEESGDAARGVDVDRLRSRLLGKARHRHDVAAHGHDKTCPCEQARAVDVERESRGSSAFLGIVRERIWRLGDVDRQIAEALAFIASQPLLGLLGE